MSITLSQILALVGEVDDPPGACENCLNHETMESEGGGSIFTTDCQ